MNQNPMTYLKRKFWRRRQTSEWIAFACVPLVMLLGGVAGAATAIDGRLLNPRALLIAGSVVAAYKTIETVVGAFGEEDNDFDDALDNVFKFVAGWTTLAATGYAIVQTLMDDSYWFAGSTLVFCIVFAVIGASRAVVPFPNGQHDAGTTDSP